MEHSITISRLPDRQAILRWRQDGFSRWISLCGVDAGELLEAHDESLDVAGRVFRLSDPFSKSPPWNGKEVVSAREFLENSTPVLRANLLHAVRSLTESLEHGERVIVFCHLGQSRSPLVAAGGLMIVHQLEPIKAWQEIANDHPDLKLTRLGLAALKWIESDANQKEARNHDIS